MGFFDRFRAKPTPPPDLAPAAPPPPAQAPATPAAPPVSSPADSSVEAPPEPALGGNVKPLLAEARQKLDAHDLPAALALYERVLAVAGDRADVLVTISGDLGVTGHLREIVHLVAPRYDATRHGPATGVNLVQAYLALREADAAQHVLDLLFALNRPELEERLHGFSNAIADLLLSGQSPLPDLPPADSDDPAVPTAPGAPAAPPPGNNIDLVSLTKPIWFYGLEPLAARILPPKEGRLRRVAFAHLSLPGADRAAKTSPAEIDELARWSRALPAWLAETFTFSPLYAPIAVLGVRELPGLGRRFAAFPAEWSTDNLRQIVATNADPLDYVFTGALRQQSGDTELILRVWEVKKFRERKQFLARWTPSTVDAELGRLHEQLRAFMEWTPDERALAYAPPPSPTAWLELLDASAALFLAGKNLLAREALETLRLADPASPLNASGGAVASGIAASPAGALAWLTLAARARDLGLTVPPRPLPDDDLTAAARTALSL